MKIALCCIAKCENLYLSEWVNHHLNLGFDHIYIYDNNDTDGERCEDIIGKENPNVTVLKYFIGKKQKGCETQIASYNDFYQRFGGKYDWVLYLDVDEFLVLNGYKNVCEYIKDITKPSTKSVRLNWKCYDDNDNLHYECLPVRERFTRVCEDETLSYYKKNFYRTKLNGFKAINVHYSNIRGDVVDCDGKYATYSTFVTSDTYNHNKAYIAHYATKSADEYYMVKKKRRGNGIGNDRLSIEHYFKYNKRTEEKERYLTDLFDGKIDSYTFNTYTQINKNNSTKIAICAIAKNENLYIREWVEYHKNIGIDKIFIYDNNEKNGECVSDIIYDYIENGFVSIIDVKGKHIKVDKKIAEKTKYHGLQQECFENCFKNNKRMYDWLCFIDIDEFIHCDINIKLFLKDFTCFDAILLNWVVYGDNNKLIYENIKLQDRFPTPSKKRQYPHVKTILNCKTKKTVDQIDAHLCHIQNGIYVDSKKNRITPEYKKDIVLGNLYIKHYLTKTAEEWVLRKYKNTSATGKDYFNESFDKRILEFFSFNEETDVKKHIINRTIRLMDSLNSKTIVALTSFGERLYNDAYISINSILSQTLVPDKICLTLFKDDLKYLPVTIKTLIDNGVVDLIISDLNLKPHLKYFYAMQKYRDANIITIDDDHVYESNMIEKLLETHKKYPTCVVARRCHYITRDFHENPMPYKKWNFEYNKLTIPDKNLFATGVGGVLYPPDILEICNDNINDIIKCINADDIYLKWLETKKHINVVWSENNSFCGKTINSKFALKNRLQDKNWLNGGNDEYLKIYKI